MPAILQPDFAGIIAAVNAMLYSVWAVPLALSGVAWGVWVIVRRNPIAIAAWFGALVIAALVGGPIAGAILISALTALATWAVYQLTGLF